MFKTERDRTDNSDFEAETSTFPTGSHSESPNQSVIGADLTIVGNLVCAGDLKVDGRVDGDITCRILTLGAEPVINSKVKADTVRICGAFTGEVRARKVILTSTARVQGDLYHEHLEIERGATYQGYVGRLADPAAKTSEQVGKAEQKITALKTA